MFGRYRLKQKVLVTVAPHLTKGAMPRAFDVLPKAEQAVALKGIIRSQMPLHDPAHENLPELAGEWLRRYDSGVDCTRWYASSAAIGA